MLRELSPCVLGVLFLKGVGVVLGGWDSMGKLVEGNSKLNRRLNGAIALQMAHISTIEKYAWNAQSLCGAESMW